MQKILNLLEVLLPSLYAGCAAAYLARFRYGKVVAPRATRHPVLATLAVHLLYMVLWVTQYKQCPMLTLRGGVIFMAAAITIIYLLLEKRSDQRTTGFMVLPLTWMLLVLGISLSTTMPRSIGVERSPLMNIHAALAILGMAAMMISAVHGVLYLVLHHDLKTGRLGLAFERLPALETLKHLTLWPARLGLVFFLAGMVLGGALMGHLQVSEQHVDPKILTASAAFLAYLVAVIGDLTSRMRGQTIAVLTLIGFAFLCLTLGIPLFVRSFHSFS